MADLDDDLKFCNETSICEITRMGFLVFSILKQMNWISIWVFIMTDLDDDLKFCIDTSNWKH